MVHSILTTLAGACIGLAMITMFYAAVKTQWPSNYASSTNDYGMIVNRTIFHYFIFSLGPTYFTVLIVSTTVARYHGNGFLCALTIGLIHSAQRYGLHFYKTFSSDQTAQRNPTLLLDAAVILSVIGIACLAGFGPPFGLNFVVPPFDEFFKSLWGTIFVAVLAAFVIAKTKIRPDMNRLLKRSRRELGSELLDFARSQAALHDTDPNLTEAILLTENLQRPGWFRWLERQKGRLFPAGTYGVMQVAADRPIADEESIRRATSGHLAGVKLTKDRYGSEYESLNIALKSYNDNPNFIDVARQIYNLVSPADPFIPEIPLPASEPTDNTSGTPPEATTVALDSKTVPDETLDGQLVGDAARRSLVAIMLLADARPDEVQTLTKALQEFISKVTARDSATPSAD